MEKKMENEMETGIIWRLFGYYFLPIFRGDCLLPLAWLRQHRHYE